MFSVTAITEDGFDKILLTDAATGTIAAIIPSCGAILHGFSVAHQGRSLNVIDHYTDAGDFKNNITSKGFKGCKLSPFVCRLRNGGYSFGSSSYKIQKFYLGSHALHGLIYDAAFVVTTQQSNETCASVTMKYEYRKEDPGFPFDLDCIISYELHKENQLRIITTVINKGDTALPLSDGWHPYFSFGGKIDDLQLQFKSKAMLVFDDELLPTGELLPYHEFETLKVLGDKAFDNCFTLDPDRDQPLCVIRDARQKIQIEIRPDENYPYLQIYTPPHRQSIAIENLSAAPDAFNNGMGLMRLDPGADASFSTSYTIRSLE